MPSPVSRTSTTTASPSRRVRPEGARAIHRVDGVVDEVGPDLVELALVGLDERNVGAPVAHHDDATAQLGPRTSRVLSRPSRTSTLCCDPRSICEYDLIAGHELRDATRRLPHLGEEGRDVDRAARPTAAMAPSPSSGRRRRCPLDPRAVDTGGDEGGSELPRPGDAGSAQPVRRAPPPGRPSRAGRAGSWAGGAHGASRSRLLNCSRSGRRLPCWRSASRRPSQARSSSSAERAAAAAGLLISWASPAASVPRVTSAVALPRGGLDRARRPVEARDEVSGHRQPVVGQLVQPLGRHPQQPARRRRRAPSRGRRRARPRLGTLRPTGPARPSGRRRRLHDRCAATSSRAPSTTTHQWSACSPSRKSTVARLDRDLVAAGEQGTELVVTEPVEDRDPAQV